MRLSGQEYVDMYATRAKDEQKKADADAKAAVRAAAEQAAADATAAISEAEGATESKAS